MRSSRDEWNHWLKHAENHFKDHKAKLVFNNEDFTVIDWRNKNGESNYYINFFVDKRRGSLHVDGDLGSSIATWYNRLKISDLKSYIYNDVEYYMGKLQCTSHKYCYDEDDAFLEFEDYIGKENIEDYIELSDKYYDFEEFKTDVTDEICNSMRGKDFVVTDRLYEIATEFDADAFEWISSIGQSIDGRVYLWAIGFYMAVTQLEDKAIL